MGRLEISVVTLVLALVATACSTVTGDVVTLELPDIDAVPRHVPEQSHVYDAEGNELAVLRTEFRERVELDDLPPTLVDAVVAAEDRRFWVHGGIDARAVLRAALANTAADRAEQGASTITQQLVKNLYLHNAPRTGRTKLREALLARQLEAERSKEEILEDYLNTVYFGAGAYGVQAAAWTYWRKDVSDLATHQAALLAALIRSPEALAPDTEVAAARAARNHVLDAMVAEDRLSAQAARAARQRPVDVEPRPPTPDVERPRWVDFVVRRLLSDPTFGETEADRAARLFGGGLHIHTTLRPDVREEAASAAHAVLPDPDDPEVGVVLVDPRNGEILATVGGRDYDRRQFDLATQARRQAGSTFKIFVLTAAVLSGLGPDDRVDGNQGTLSTRNGPWTVRNYNRVSYGSITLEEATRASVNAAFARLGLDLGVDRVAAIARAMGVRSPLNEDPPIVLGALEQGVSPLDMASATATLANLGEHVPVSPISRIEDSDGEVVWRPRRSPERVVEPSAAFVVTRMLQTVVERGTGTAARVPGWEVAGKTGTTQDYADAWFVGYTPTLAVAVWVGHPQGRIPMRGVRGVGRVTGGSLPARIFRDVVTAVLADESPVDFHLPERYYEVVDVDPATGLRSAPWCASEERAIPRAIAPREVCPSPEPPPPPPSPSPPPGSVTCPPATAGPSPAPSPRGETCQQPTEPAPGPGGASPTPAEQ